VKCDNCKNPFQYLLCPHCKEDIYYKKCDYVQGIKQICSKCNRAFQHVNCPGCVNPIFFKQSDFIFGKNCKCNECQINFCLTVCNKCGEINNIIDRMNEVDVPSYFECSICDNKYQLLCCPFCKNQLNDKGKCSNNNCLCKNETKDSKVNDKNKKKDDNLNNNHNKAKKSEDKDKDKYICKVCFDGQVDTIFINCGHVCACYKCASSLKKKECPMCRVIGKYKRCFF